MLMVNEDRMLKFKNVQQEHVEALRELLVLCEALRPSTKFAQKYMKEVGVLLEFIANSLKILIAKHTLVASPSELLPRQLFADVELLNTYKDVLFGSIKLIFNKDTSAFRMRTEPSFTQNVVKIYMALMEFRSIWASETLQLKSMIHAFQYQFGSNYNVANCNILNLNQVRDLLSQTFDLISPPLLDVKSVAKRDYFRLSLERFGYNELLVELFQLSNGELAIFKVNCGELPAPTCLANDLLQRLFNGEYKLLDLGRTLLFPGLREYDLEVERLIDAGTELRTPTGNNVHLRLQCLDAMQWESHWKFCFQKLFDKKNIIPPVLQSSTLAPMTRSSHPFQSFKFKHQKLEDLRPKNNSGIAIQMPQQVLDSQRAKENSIKDFKKDSFKLHKSKPLERPSLSLMEEVDLSNTPKRNATNNTMFKSPSLRDIEKLSCSKLLELDKSIDMNLSQTALETPEMKECKSISQHSSLEKIGPVLGGDIEESDIESDDDNENKENSIFNPSAEVYKPTLYRRKSSSLLNLFRPKNKKKSSVDSITTTTANNNNGVDKNDSRFSLSHKNSSSSLFGPRSIASSSLSSKSSLNSLLKPNNDVELPAGIELNNENTLFESRISKISSWNGRLWEPIRFKKLNLVVIKSENGENILVVHEERETYFCKLAARITPQWKCSRGGAQDVQLSIPSDKIMVTALPKEDQSLNVRCVEADRLQNFLQHCMEADAIVRPLPGSLPNSITAGTLSSNGSSFLSDQPTSIASNLSALKLTAETTNTTLLLPNIRVKRYIHSENNAWQEQHPAMLDLHAHEYKGLLLGIVFRFLENGKDTDLLFVGLSEMRRIGTTGLLLACKDEERFLEFQNKVVADQVHRMIRP